MSHYNGDNEITLRDDLSILNEHCAVTVSRGGTFSVYRVSGGEFEPVSISDDSTYEGAIEGAKPRLRAQRIKVSVPFYFHGKGIKQIATSIHAGTNNVMYGNGEQYTGYGRDTFSGDIPEYKLERYAELGRQMKTLNAERHQIEEDYALNLKEAVLAAIEEARQPKVEA